MGDGVINFVYYINHYFFPPIIYYFTTTIRAISILTIYLCDEKYLLCIKK